MVIDIIQFLIPKIVNRFTFVALFTKGLLVEMGKDFIGVDYGSKLAGTTVISYIDEKGALQLLQSQRKKSADDFLIQNIKRLKPKQIFLDAPLSLPGIYQKLRGCENYFYRECDQLLKAMSPMFIGGLTARAIKLKDQFLSLDIECIESYPKQIAKRLEIPDDEYKNADQSAAVINFLNRILPFTINPSMIQNLHQIDSILCLYLGFQYQKGLAKKVGNEAEGLIWY